jgi:hypothetical protein
MEPDIVPDPVCRHKTDHKGVISQSLRLVNMASELDIVNRRPKRTPYRRPKGTPFVERRDGYDGRFALVAA